MVDLVQPLFQSALARSIGGPQPGLAPLGEGFTSGAGLLGGTGGNASQAGGGLADILGGLGAGGGQAAAGSAFANILGGQQGGGQAAGGGDFLTGLFSNPAFQAGVEGLRGNSPLQALQTGLQVKAQQQVRAEDRQIKLRALQRQEQTFRAAQAQQARQQQALAELRPQIEAAENLSEGQKMALNLGIDTGDLAVVNGLLGAVAKQEDFEPVKDADGNITGQRNTTTNEVIASQQADVRQRQEQLGLTRRGQDITARGQDLTAANAAATRAATAAGKAADGSKTEFDQTKKLRDEFTKQSGEFVKIRDSFGRVQAAAAEPSAAGDLALIFNYMKILDPGSTVREGEFATAQNAGSVDDRTLAFYNRIVNGERLSDSQRTDFVGQAGKLFGSQAQQQDRLVEDYTNLAGRNNLDPQDVVRDLARAPAAPRSPAQLQNLPLDQWTVEEMERALSPPGGAP